RAKVEDSGEGWVSSVKSAPAFLAIFTGETPVPRQPRAFDISGQSVSSTPIVAKQRNAACVQPFCRTVRLRMCLPDEEKNFAIRGCAGLRLLDGRSTDRP